MLLVTGATGNFGTAAVLAARAAGAEVRALVHSPDKAKGLAEQGVDVAIGDMDRPESLAAALRGVTKLFLIGPMSPRLAELETKTLAAARAAGVVRVVKVSALSVGSPYQAGLGDWHAAAEAALRDSGLEATVLRSAATMGTPLRMGSIDDGVLRAPGGDGAASYCAPADVGELGVRILEDGGHGGKTYAVTGPEALDLGRVAAIVSAETGRALRYEATSEEDHAKRLEARGMPKPIIGATLSFFQRVRASAFADVERTCEEVLGRPGTSYATWARGSAAAFLP
jgi:uncharacterized protein YbjT (DUF2867 family)